MVVRTIIWVHPGSDRDPELLLLLLLLLLLSDLVNIFCFENLVVKQHCTLNNFSSFVLNFYLYLIISCKV